MTLLIITGLVYLTGQDKYQEKKSNQDPTIDQSDDPRVVESVSWQAQVSVQGKDFDDDDDDNDDDDYGDCDGNDVQQSQSLPILKVSETKKF